MSVVNVQVTVFSLLITLVAVQVERSKVHVTNDSPRYFVVRVNHSSDSPCYYAANPSHSSDSCSNPRDSPSHCRVSPMSLAIVQFKLFVKPNHSENSPSDTIDNPSYFVVR